MPQHDPSPIADMRLHMARLRHGLGNVCLRLDAQLRQSTINPRTFYETWREVQALLAAEEEERCEG